MDILEVIRRELQTEAEAIIGVGERLGRGVEDAVKMLLECKGKVILTGLGKTGIIARKISATLASTGTTSVFLHAAEGLHGDLGMIAPGDVLVAVSNSGNTEELLAIVPYAKFIRVPIIALTGNPDSRLASVADIVIDCGVPRDADPFGYVPTASTTAALAVGDAIAVALLKLRNFDLTDFARFHPGGTIGRKLLLTVGELMHAADKNPVVPVDMRMDEVIVVMISGGLGCAGVIDEWGVLVGIITDGDFKRVLTRNPNLLSLGAGAVMTANPKRGRPEMLAIEALNLMEEYKITMLPVVDAEHKPVGMLHLHDLIQAGVVG